MYVHTYILEHHGFGCLLGQFLILCTAKSGNKAMNIWCGVPAKISRKKRSMSECAEVPRSWMSWNSKPYRESMHTVIGPVPAWVQCFEAIKHGRVSWQRGAGDGSQCHGQLGCPAFCCDRCSPWWTLRCAKKHGTKKRRNNAQMENGWHWNGPLSKNVHALAVPKFT